MFLTDCSQNDDFHNKKPLRASGCSARTSLRHSVRGSMSLEAAAAVPLFIFFVMNLLFLFDAIRLQSGLQAALQQAGEQVCEAAYYTRYGKPGQAAGEADSETGELSGASSLILSETFVRNKVTSYLGDAFWEHSCVVGGRAGLSFAQSRIMTDGDRVEIVVNCRIRPFIRVVAFPDFSMQARYCGHAWVGWTEGSGDSSGSGRDDEDDVLVTRYGDVYHNDPDCIYLNPQIRSVPASEVSQLRSADGSRYYPCECCRPGHSGRVFITKEGNRYHADKSCSGLVRHVSTMSEEEAEKNYRPCSKCGRAH